MRYVPSCLALLIVWGHSPDFIILFYYSFWGEMLYHRETPYVIAIYIYISIYIFIPQTSVALGVLAVLVDD